MLSAPKHCRVSGEQGLQLRPGFVPGRRLQQPEVVFGLPLKATRCRQHLGFTSVQPQPPLEFVFWHRPSRPRSMRARHRLSARVDNEGGSTASSGDGEPEAKEIKAALPVRTPEHLTGSLVSTGPQLSSPALLQFWQQLPAAIVAGGFLRLAPGTFFLGAPSNGDCLLVRKCYLELYDSIQQLMDLGNTKIVVTGNPGIGKTVFTFFLLHVLAKQGSKVVYEDCMVERRLLFDGDVVLDGARTDFMEDLREPSTWYVSDGVALASWPVAARTVLVASPDVNNYKNFLKERHSTMLYMPVWERDEILRCWTVLYSRSVSRDAVVELYSVFGGTPRYVLEQALDLIFAV